MHAVNWYLRKENTAIELSIINKHRVQCHANLLTLHSVERRADNKIQKNWCANQNLAFSYRTVR